MKSLSLKILFPVAFVLLSINTISAMHPVKAKNPWKDDYRDISSIENYKSWGTYNVHDPAVLRVGDTYYMYSTDAIYFDRSNHHRPKKHIKIGNIQVRTSKDLVHWKFEGWAFDSIPEAAVKWVRSHSNNRGATNIWAPYAVHYKNIYRLYYCVSAFGKQDSYLGMAESSSPLGPWKQKGYVVRTKGGDKMNAIDPTVITEQKTGKMWMYYGSFFGGLFVVQLNPQTGLTLVPGDQGKVIARRAHMHKDNIEAAEIIYNPKLKKYFLFMSYDPLMTTYNVRVGRSDNPNGPFYDYFGNDLRDTINHYPILTHPYRFKHHPGWAGTGHCGVFCDANGHYFMVHQGRLSPANELMDLHVRAIKWTQSGWPVVSPERYDAVAQHKITKKDILGTWEIIRIQDSTTNRNLEFGQILYGENHLRKTEVDLSKEIKFLPNGQINNSKSESKGKWEFSDKNGLKLLLKHETINNLIVFYGHDWENQTNTLLFTGLDKNGCSVWGKMIE